MPSPNPRKPQGATSLHRRHAGHQQAREGDTQTAIAGKWREIAGNCENVRKIAKNIGLQSPPPLQLVTTGVAGPGPPSAATPSTPAGCTGLATPPPLHGRAQAPFTRPHHASVAQYSASPVLSCSAPPFLKPPPHCPAGLRWACGGGWRPRGASRPRSRTSARTFPPLFLWKFLEMFLEFRRKSFQKIQKSFQKWSKKPPTGEMWARWKLSNNCRENTANTRTGWRLQANGQHSTVVGWSGGRRPASTGTDGPGGCRPGGGGHQGNGSGLAGAVRRTRSEAHPDHQHRRWPAAPPPGLRCGRPTLTNDGKCRTTNAIAER